MLLSIASRRSHYSVLPGSPAMPTHINKRLPSSCENCRKRKIRCGGLSAPCDPCVRRGLAASCYYVRDDNGLQDHSQGLARRESSLIARITRIEELLLTHIALASTGKSIQSDAGTSPHTTLPTRISEDTVSEGLSVRGRLIHSPSGHVRYVTHSADSGPALVDQLFMGSDPWMGLQPDFPFSPDTSTTRQQLLDILPPMAQCDGLKQVFLDVFSPLFHILHEPTFNASFDQFRRNPEEVPLAFLALVFVIFAIAGTALRDEDPMLNDAGHDASIKVKIRRIHSKYLSAAMRCLSADKFMWRHSLTTLKALILMIYSISHTSGSSWALLGTTFNIAVAIGCHIDPSQFPELSITEAEERRRSWAALRMLHTIQNTCLGNIAPLSFTSNVSMPEDVEDEQIGHGRFVEDGHSSQGPSKMTYLLHKFQLYQFAGRICQLPMSASDLNYAHVEVFDAHLENEEAVQIRKFSRLQNLPTYHQAHYLILNIYTNHLFLILHKQYLLPSGELSDARRLRSLRRCVQCSVKTLRCYDKLCSANEFRPYQWYVQGLGTFYALLAASTLIVASSDALLEDELSSSMVIRLLQTSLQRFREMAYRSDICLAAQRLLEKIRLPDEPSTPLRSTPSHSSPDGFSNREVCQSEEQSAMLASPIVVDQGLQPGEPVQSLPTYDFDLGGEQRGSTECVPSSTGYHRQREQQSHHHNYSGERVDLDGWTFNPELLGFVSETSHEDWLSPANFQWERWFPSAPGATLVYPE